MTLGKKIGVCAIMGMGLVYVGQSTGLVQTIVANLAQRHSVRGRSSSLAEHKDSWYDL